MHYFLLYLQRFLKKKGSNIRIFYKQLKNNIPNETLCMQILQLSSAHHANAYSNVLRLREEAICRRRVAMFRGRVARKAERGAAHRRTILQRCRPAHQFG